MSKKQCKNSIEVLAIALELTRYNVSNPEVLIAMALDDLKILKDDHKAIEAILRTVNDKWADIYRDRNTITPTSDNVLG